MRFSTPSNQYSERLVCHAGNSTTDLVVPRPLNMLVVSAPLKELRGRIATTDRDAVRPIVTLRIALVWHIGARPIHSMGVVRTESSWSRVQRVALVFIVLDCLMGGPRIIVIDELA